MKFLVISLSAIHDKKAHNFNNLFYWIKFWTFLFWLRTIWVRLAITVSILLLFNTACAMSPTAAAPMVSSDGSPAKSLRFNSIFNFPSPPKEGPSVWEGSYIKSKKILWISSSNRLNLIKLLKLKLIILTFLSVTEAD